MDPSADYPESYKSRGKRAAAEPLVSDRLNTFPRLESSINGDIDVHSLETLDGINTIKQAPLFSGNSSNKSGLTNDLEDLLDIDVGKDNSPTISRHYKETINPTLSALSIFSSLELSTQGLRSYKKLVDLYNVVTDDEHISINDGTADKLVNAGTWARLHCWKTLYRQIRVAGSGSVCPNGPPIWSFKPKRQTVVVGWDCHDTYERHNAHDCGDAECLPVFADIHWVFQEFGIRCPVVKSPRTQHHKNSPKTQPYTSTKNFVCAPWGGDYLAAVEANMIGPLAEYNRQMFSWLARSLHDMWMIPLDVGGDIRKGWLLDLQLELDKYAHTMPC